MTEALESVVDHVAIAVPDPDRAEARWRGRLGGAPVFAGEGRGFAFRQLRFAGGGKLELLSPRGPGFVSAFLDRFGSRVHHVTLKVPDVAAALPVLESHGLDPVDVDLTDPAWHEAFLRPSQVGGLVVQIAWARDDDAALAAGQGNGDGLPGPAAATLHGPLLRHPDLATAARLWTSLGADVTHEDTRLHCRWHDAPLDLLIEPGTPVGPFALHLTGTPALPADPTLGPAVETAPA